MRRALLIYLTIGTFCLLFCKNEPKHAPENLSVLATPVVTAAVGDTATFMRNFRTAINQRDKVILLGLMADSVYSGFADGNGPCPGGCPKSTVVEKLFETTDNENWKVFDHAQRYGLGVKGDEPDIFYGPFYPGETTHLGNNKVYVYATNVNVREKPDIKSKVLTQVSKTWLEEAPSIRDKWIDNGDYDKLGWIPVVFAPSKIGYLSESFTNWQNNGYIRVKKDKNGQLKIIELTYDMVCAL